MAKTSTLALTASEVLTFLSDHSIQPAPSFCLLQLRAKFYDQVEHSAAGVVPRAQDFFQEMLDARLAATLLQVSHG